MLLKLPKYDLYFIYVVFYKDKYVQTSLTSAVQNQEWLQNNLIKD